MNLKEAFRFQNKLQSFINNAQLILKERAASNLSVSRRTDRKKP